MPRPTSKSKTKKSKGYSSKTLPKKGIKLKSGKKYGTVKQADLGAALKQGSAPKISTVDSKVSVSSSNSNSNNRGGVRVVARFRPMNSNEKKRGSNISGPIIELLPDNLSMRFSTEAQKEMKISDDTARFTFDYIFPTSATQLDVFAQTGKDMVPELFQGFNCTILAYGQTGTGKTWSMMGIVGTKNEGVIPRIVESIFEGIENADVNIEFAVEVSYVEIYLEQIKDLLHPANDNLKIRESKAKGIWIQGVTETYVTSNQEVLDIMETGGRNRAIASTNMNAESSRSHSVFILKLTQKHKIHGSSKSSKLILVDLAGSEKVSKTGASGQTLKEAQGINKSLSALGNVIKALTSGSKHVPYRDSKLTRLLSDSLGGNSKTCLIITGTMAFYNMEETLSTMRFGKRAKQIKNKPKVNEEKSIAEYKALLAEARAKIRDQEKLIQALQESQAFIPDEGEDEFGAADAAAAADADADAEPPKSAAPKPLERDAKLDASATTTTTTTTPTITPGPSKMNTDTTNTPSKTANKSARAAVEAKMKQGTSHVSSQVSIRTDSVVNDVGTTITPLTMSPRTPRNGGLPGTPRTPGRRPKTRRLSAINTIVTLQSKCAMLHKAQDDLKDQNTALEDQLSDAKNDLNNLTIKMDALKEKLQQADTLRQEAVDGVSYVLSKRLTLAQQEAKLGAERILHLTKENHTLKEKLHSKQHLAETIMEETKKSLHITDSTNKVSVDLKGNESGGNSQPSAVTNTPTPSTEPTKTDGKSDPKVSPGSMEALQAQNDALMEDLAKKCAELIQMRMELEDYQSEESVGRDAPSSSPDEVEFHKQVIKTKDENITLLEGALHDSNVFARKMYDEYEGKIKSLKTTITKQRYLLETTLKPQQRMVKKIMGGGGRKRNLEGWMLHRRDSSDSGTRQLNEKAAKNFLRRLQSRSSVC